MNRSWIVIISTLGAIIAKSLSALNDSSQDMPSELVSEPSDIPDSAVENSSQVVARPLLTFSQRIPIEISQENRQNILGSSEQEKKALEYNQEVLEQSRIPWIELLAALLVGSFLLALRYGTTKAKEPAETLHQRVARVRQESLDALDALQQQEPLPQGHYILFYETISNTIRRYVDEKYQLHLSSGTSQEFLQKIGNPPMFDGEMQSRLNQLFVKAELVKFAKQQPTLEECQKAELTARELLKD